MDFTLLSLVPSVNQEPNQKPDPVHGWRFDKTVNLPFVVGVVGLVLAGTAWVTSIDERMARVEQVMAEVADQNRTLDRLVVKVENLEKQVEEVRNDHFDSGNSR